VRNLRQLTVRAGANGIRCKLPILHFLAETHFEAAEILQSIDERHFGPAATLQSLAETHFGS
jgi:hypothetical protein